MITKLMLKNFRCFQDFTLDGVRPVTLIAGANNVGKSTILESVFLFMDRRSSDVFLKLNAFRGVQEMNNSPKMVWEPLFADMDSTKPLSIGLSVDGKPQTVTVTKDETFLMSATAEMPIAPNIQSPTANSYPLKLVFKSDTRNDISHFLLTQGGITLTQQKPATTKPPLTQYLGSKISQNASVLSEWFGSLELKGKKSECVKVLQILDPRIQDLSVIVIGGLSGVYADIGLSSRLSINMLGDGMNKLMQIALVMLSNPGSIVLVDEIENGFHYSFFPKLWEIIGKLAEETECQLFITTHSYECISGATVIATENPNLFRFVRLDRNGGTVIPKLFENDSFEYAVKNEIEVR
jgi:energy-coupling factor transporter ATP-binding protein EcfA2